LAGSSSLHPVLVKWVIVTWKTALWKSPGAMEPAFKVQTLLEPCQTPTRWMHRLAPSFRSREKQLLSPKAAPFCWQLMRPPIHAASALISWSPSVTCLILTLQTVLIGWMKTKIPLVSRYILRGSKMDGNLLNPVGLQKSPSLHWNQGFLPMALRQQLPTQDRLQEQQKSTVQPSSRAVLSRLPIWIISSIAHLPFPSSHQWRGIISWSLPMVVVLGFWLPMQQNTAECRFDLLHRNYKRNSKSTCLNLGLPRTRLI